jgi:hypothetical protein
VKNDVPEAPLGPEARRVLKDGLTRSFTANPRELVSIAEDADPRVHEWVPLGAPSSADFISEFMLRAEGRLFPWGQFLGVWVRARPGQRDEVEALGLAIGVPIREPPPRWQAPVAGDRPAVEGGKRLEPTMRGFLARSAALDSGAVAVLVLLTASVLVGTVESTLGVEGADRLLRLMVSVQACICLIIFVVTYRLARLPDDEDAPDVVRRLRTAAEVGSEHRIGWLKNARTALESADQLRWGTLAIATGWLLLYGTLTLESYTRVMLPAQDVPRWLLAGLAVLEAAFNNVASLGMLVCFLVMTYATTGSAPNSPPPTPLRWVWGCGAACILALGIGDYVTCLLADGSWTDPHLAYDIASGLLGGVTLALWVGRLDSRFIDLNPLLSACLYLYSAIQPLYFVVRAPGALGGLVDVHKVQLTLFLCAAVLKVALTLTVAWLFQSGRLAFFLAQIRSLEQSVQESWRDSNGLPVARTSVHRSPGQTGLSLLFSVAAFLAVSTVGAGIMLARDGRRASGDAELPELHGAWSAKITWDVTNAIAGGLIPTCVPELVATAQSRGTILLGSLLPSTATNEARRTIGYSGWSFETQLSDAPRGAAANAHCSDEARLSVRLDHARLRNGRYVLDLITESRWRQSSGATTTRPPGTRLAQVQPNWCLDLAAEDADPDLLTGWMFHIGGEDDCHPEWPASRKRADAAGTAELRRIQGDRYLVFGPDQFSCPRCEPSPDAGSSPPPAPAPG